MADGMSFGAGRNRQRGIDRPLIRLRQTACTEENPERTSTHGEQRHLVACLQAQATGLGQTRASVHDQDRLDLVLGVYRRPPNEIADSVLPGFVERRRDLLEDIYDAYATDDRDTFGPDVLLIFELLERVPDQLRQAWAKKRSLDELEELATIYGVAL